MATTPDRDDGPPTSKGQFTPDQKKREGTKKQKYNAERLGAIGTVPLQRQIVNKQREIRQLKKNLETLNKLGKASVQINTYQKELGHLKKNTDETVETIKEEDIKKNTASYLRF